MNTSMDDDGRFGASATATIEMNSGDRAASIGISGNYDLRVARIRSLEIFQELEMVFIRMVRVEPRGISTSDCHMC